LGTTRAWADASGAVTSSLGHDSFGNTTSGSPLSRYTFTGREYDSDTDVMYYRARWYDPEQGRFISEDPIGLRGGLNFYAYTENDPVWANDLFGLASLLVMVGPRSRGGSGGAYILLLDKYGNRINACGCQDEYFYGRAVASNPNRMLHNVGDTPFGVYAYRGYQGGQATTRISPSFGTGKIIMDGVFGEIMTSGRSLIRLHGGGKNLRKRIPPEDPYASDQDLLPTEGCIRMKNRDVNALIQAIMNLPKDDPLQFIFVGDSPYLHHLAGAAALAKTRWQPVLKTNLGIP
jgi:RHS repeat-associated protein